MIAKISEVTRIYRTNEIWREEDQAWQQGGWQDRPLVSSKESAELVFQRYAFGHHARTAATALANVLHAASQLKQASDALLGSSSSLDTRYAESSNPSAVHGAVGQHAAISSYTVHVKQTAKSHIHTGNLFDSDAATLIAAGSNQMKLTMDGQTHSFSIYILPVDTNYQVLQKIRGAIMQTQANLQVELLRDLSNKTVQLKINSKDTGAGQAFTIQDVYGNAAEISGIHNLTQQAEDAIYQINGEAFLTSAVNEIRLADQQVALQLLAASKEEPVIVAIHPDTAGITQQVQHLIQCYNSLHLLLTQSGELLSSEASAAVIDRHTSTPLEPIGLQWNPDGSLKLDSHVLEQQANTHFTELELGLRGSEGMIAELNKAATKLLDPPSYELLDQTQALFQSFNNYQVSEWDEQPVNTYLPVPLSGILMNNYI